MLNVRGVHNVEFVWGDGTEDILPTIEYPSFEYKEGDHITFKDPFGEVDDIRACVLSVSKEVIDFSTTGVQKHIVKLEKIEDTTN